MPDPDRARGLPAGNDPARGRLGIVLLPLRAFLGFTFCFAGLQKLANPGFFDASNPASIQAQLAGSARTSPVHALISPLAHQAVALGVLIAFGELAVGLGTLAGLWTKLAAAGGMALSLMLFLTVSFHTRPYYTGSDIVFLFAWTPLLLGGAGDVLALDAFLRGRQEQPDAWGAARPGPAHGAAAGGIGRRVFAAEGAAAALLGLAGLTLGGMTALIGRVAGGSGGQPAPPAPGGGGAVNPSGTGKSSGGGGSGSPHPQGTSIGLATQVPVGGSASFTDPSSGDPSLVVQPSRGKFAAFDAVCPHAGCTVSYQPEGRLFVCPCHGSEFNGQSGAVISGPAPRGLGRIRVSKGPGGKLYVT